MHLLWIKSLQPDYPAIVNTFSVRACHQHSSGLEAELTNLSNDILRTHKREDQALDLFREVKFEGFLLDFDFPKEVL